MIIALGMASGAVVVQTGKRGVFAIHNDTPGNTVVGFYTNAGNGWSRNWLSEPLKPDENARAEFTEDRANCNQTMQVGWLSRSGGEVKDDPIRINFCPATNVYLKDNGASFD